MMTPHDALPSRLLKVKQVAEVLQLSPRTVRRMIADGRLPVIRVGRAVRVHPSAVATLMEGSGQEKSGDD